MNRLAWLLALLCLTGCARDEVIVVGSKNFTESVLLGEIVAQRLEKAGCRVDRKLDLGGTLVCDRAIVSGAIDVYPEYSGTALAAVLNQPIGGDRQSVMTTVAREYTRRQLRWGPALGFENTFAMIVRRTDATRLGLRAISDLQRVQDTFRPGFGYEFVERQDGWGGLQKHYALRFRETPRTMDLGLTYRALASGQIDLIAGNSTDGLIGALDLAVLADDRRFFPPYDAVIVSRSDIARKCAAAPAAIDSLQGTLTEETMRRLNYKIDGEKIGAADVAKEFVSPKR